MASRWCVVLRQALALWLLGSLAWGAEKEVRFLRSDVDGDGRLSVTDAVRLVSYLFGGGLGSPSVPCEDGADANDDGVHTATDPIYLGNALFRGGPTIPPPFPEPGLDPTPDEVAECSLGA